MAETDDKQGGNNWSVQEYYALLRAADAIYTKTPEGKREYALNNEDLLQEEHDRLCNELGIRVKRDGKTLLRTLETLKGLHKLIRDKLPHELPVNAPDGFFWRKGTKRLWDCFRDASFREVCDAVMFKIDTTPAAPIEQQPLPPPEQLTPQHQQQHVPLSHPHSAPPVHHHVPHVDPSPKHATPKSAHGSRYYGSMASPHPVNDPVAIERLTYIIEAQQGNIADMLTKLYGMHQEQLQQQTQQAQQLNASLHALLGESERYFHEVVQINQQLVGQLRDLFAATVTGPTEAGKTAGGPQEDDDARAKRRKAEAPATTAK